MSRKQGKVIETIKYHSNGKLFHIPVRLITDKGYSYASRNISFSYAVELDEPRFKQEGADPAILVKAAQEAIDAHTSITWEKFLYVETSRIDQQHQYREKHGHNVGVWFQAVLIGTNCKGDKFHCYLDKLEDTDVESRHGPGRSVNLGVPETEIGKPTWDQGVETTALIPFTDDNLKRLRAICAGLNNIGTMVTDLMQPKNIETSLARVQLQLKLAHK